MVDQEVVEVIEVEIEVETEEEIEDVAAEVEAVVVENNVAAFVLGKAQVTDKVVPFDELMAG